MIIFTSNFDITEDQKQKYIESIVKEKNCSIDDIDTINAKLLEDDNVELEFTIKGKPFERIRRITGYLVGTIDRWNDSKRCEEKDRVKHI